MDLAVEGLLALPDGVRKGALGIDLASGSIVAVKRTLRADRVLDVGDRLVTPGALDVHVHFRDPGLTRKEDWTTGTTAAACGGVTTVFDMPNTKPPARDGASLADKYAVARRKACVDFGLWSSAKPDADLRFLGAASGLKLFLGPTTGDLPTPRPEEIPALLAGAARAGIPVAVHAEDAGRFRDPDRPARTLADHDRQRPPEAEASALRGLLAAYAGADPRPRLHVAHLTSRAGAEALRGAPVTFGLTPHHLLLDVSATLGARGKVNPPLRRREDMVTWDDLADPRALVESDHAPHLPEEKAEAFADAPSGLPGVETMVPLLMARVARGLMDVPALVRVACERPAALMGVHTGRLAVGMPADLAVWSKRDLAPVREAKLHSRCGWSPFAGRDAVFPSHVLRRGEAVVEDHEFVGRAGAGTFVRAGGPVARAPA